MNDSTSARQATTEPIQTGQNLRSTDPNFRLRGLTWVVLLIVAACTAVIILPGAAQESIEYERRQLMGTQNPKTGKPLWSDYDFIPVSVWSHGWPFEFMRRPFGHEGFLIDFGGCPVLWSTARAWQVSGNRYVFEPLLLAADLIIGAAIVAVAVVMCELWRRRRGAWRISLLDASLFVAAMCVALGWWKYHVSVQIAERRSIASMSARGSLSDLRMENDDQIAAVSMWDYRGPEWLHRLVGNTYLLPWCTHVHTLSLDGRKLVADDLHDISNFPFLSKVQFVDQLSTESAKLLAEVPRLQELDADINTSGTGSPSPQPIVNSSNITLLRKLPRLSTLRLGSTQLCPAAVHVLAELPQLASLQLRDRNLLVEDLEILGRSRNLHSLHLDVTSTAEERSAFIAAYPDWEIRWAKRPPSPNGLEDRFETPEEWKVMELLLQRWREEDQAEEYAEFRSHGLNLAPVRLTGARLDRIPTNVLGHVRELTLGEVESPAIAVAIARQCGVLETFDARRVPLTKADLDTLRFAPKCELYLRHGPNTASEFAALNREIRPEYLVILESDFTDAQGRQIEAASADTMFEVYRGLEEEPEELIYPVTVFDHNSPFH